MTIRKTVLAVGAIALVMLAGCGGKADIEPDAAAQTIQEKVEFKDSLVKADDAAAAVFYRLDDTITDYAIYISGTGASAEEIAVLKVADSADLETAEAIVNKRLEDLTFNFKNYRPEEMTKLENPVIIAQNNVVVFVVAEDTAAATKAVKSLF